MYKKLVYEDRKEIKIKYAIRIVGIFIAISNLLLHKYLNGVIDLLLICMSFYKKNVYIQDGNIEIKHRVIFHNYTDILPIANITDIIIKNMGAKSALCLISQYKVLKIIVEKECLEEILSHFKKVNDKIEIGE